MVVYILIVNTCGSVALLVGKLVLSQLDSLFFLVINLEEVLLFDVAHVNVGHRIIDIILIDNLNLIVTLTSIVGVVGDIHLSVVALFSV